MRDFWAMFWYVAEAESGVCGNVLFMFVLHHIVERKKGSDVVVVSQKRFVFRVKYTSAGRSVSWINSD